MRKKLIALGLALVLLTGLLPAALALTPVSDNQTAGVDVSVFQGSVDFPAARSGGVRTVYIRASYGYDGVDDYFRAHYRGALDAGSTWASTTTSPPSPRTAPGSRPASSPDSSTASPTTAARPWTSSSAA